MKKERRMTNAVADGAMLLLVTKLLVPNKISDGGFLKVMTSAKQFSVV